MMSTINNESDASNAVTFHLPSEETALSLSDIVDNHSSNVETDSMLPDKNATTQQDVQKLESVPVMTVEEKTESEDATKHRLLNFYIISMLYLSFTITDTSMRLAVLLQANSLGFTAFQIGIMFSLYEVAGVFTNLFGGVLATKYGFKRLLLIGMCVYTE